ncbi:MAG: homocysteine S-methyltransferase family protein [Thermoguttaceae bacterium]|nr:homocysteine S-methyltransferase family protein [Thermoguttaceae bacterium]
MNETIADWLSDGPLLLDGGLATSLCPAPGRPAVLWNMSAPEAVLRLHAEFAAAGSDVVLTNSFGANRFALARCGADVDAAAVNRRAAELARAAVRKGVLVFGAIGPTGASPAKGEVSRREQYLAFVEQARALADAGVDGLVIETMTDPAELREAVRAAKTTAVPVAACMTFGAGKEHDLTPSGVTVEEAAGILLDEGADIVGANCGVGVKGFLSVCRRLRAACRLPIWMKPSAGLPRVVGDKLLYDQSPEEFADAAAELVGAGASFVGGCCGTTPAYIAELRKRLGRAFRRS